MRTQILPPRAILTVMLFVVVSILPARRVMAQVAPTLIPISGELRTPDGLPRSGNVLLVISLYEGRDDSAPRWIEHQAVTLDATGHYSLQFGATRSDGLPPDLFSGPEAARWVGVGVENEPEQPRVMLVSVPYAAKAGSADLLAGKPLTDFVLTSTLQDGVRAVLQEEGDVATAAAIAGGLNFLQKGDGAGGTIDSAVFETGDNVGIGTTSPQARLHLRAALNLPAIRMENTEPAGATWQLTSANDGQFRFTEVGAATRLVIQKTTGSIGVGTSSPQSLLHLRAGLNLPAFRLENVEPAGATWQVTSANDGQFRLTEVGVASRLVVAKTSGNIGIGTSAPTSKLHVVGNAAVAGDMTVTGALGGPTIQSLVDSVAALTTRVAKLESGQIVAADMVGTYRMEFLGHQLLGNPARIGLEQFTLGFTLNADTTMTLNFTGGDCELVQGTPWAVTCEMESGSDAGGSWSVQEGKLVMVFPDGDQMDATIGAGGRVLVGSGLSEFQPGAAFGNIAIAMRLPNP
jgi:hypothetical protein